MNQLPPGLDAALGRPIYLEKTTDSSIQNILDGDTDSTWCPSEKKRSQTIKIDFGTDRRITGLAITWASNASFNSSFEILKGSSWVALQTQSGSVQANETRVGSFDASARYVRLNLNSRKKLPCIAALRVFAKPLLQTPAMLIGHDLSTLIQLEDVGKQFSDAGVVAPAEQILKRYNANLVRLRLWVDPEQNFNNLSQVKRMAVRIKAAGMKFLLDLHYSDTWADPGHQDIPKAWLGQDLSTLAQSIKTYTSNVIQELAAQNTLPDMVQVGNEITNGMLYPIGKIDGSSDPGFKNFATLVKAGIEGVKAATPIGQKLEIMIHVDRGSNAFLAQSFFGRLENAGIQYDVIGLSYYPYWNGSLSSLRGSLDALAKRFKKPIVIAETAYPHTLKDSDNYPNVIGAGAALPAAYTPTPAGQALFLRDLMSIVARTPNQMGRGIIYWESAWIPGIGWKPGEGNAWDNQAMFDQNGVALESLNAFR